MAAVPHSEPPIPINSAEQAVQPPPLAVRPISESFAIALTSFGNRRPQNKIIQRVLGCKTTTSSAAIPDKTPSNDPLPDDNSSSSSNRKGVTFQEALPIAASINRRCSTAPLVPSTFPPFFQLNRSDNRRGPLLALLPNHSSHLLLKMPLKMPIPALLPNNNKNKFSNNKHFNQRRPLLL